MTRAEILSIQRQLGLKPDGIYGPKTHDAYQRWLNSRTVGTMPTPAPPAAKPWWQSRTIIGLVASALALVAARWGWQIDDTSLAQLFMEIVQFAGLVVAFFATITRKAPIDASLVARVGGQSVRLPSTHKMSADGETDKLGPFGY